MTMREQILQKALQMAQEGGRIAREQMANMQISLKPDQSVLTAADTAVSAMVRTAIADWLAGGRHILIEEEDKNIHTHFQQKYLESAEYVWVVDPIDGTRSYSNRMPLFGMSIGVLKDLKPWIGVVYMPMLNELFVCDGESAYVTYHPFTPEATTQTITPVDQEITQQSVFFGIDLLFQYFEWDYSLCRVLLPAAAVIDLCWPAIGRACGCLFNAHIWDFCGSWPIVRAAGLELRSWTTGEPLEQVHVDLFRGVPGNTWRLRDYYILSSARNYPIIKRHMKRRPGAA